jgi:hypothetical protein
MRWSMNEAQSDQRAGADPSYDADMGGERSPSAPDDRMATTRLPPLAPPPQKQRVPSTPPPPAVQLGPGVASYASEAMARSAMPSAVQPRTSWLKTVFASTSVAPPLPDRVLERRLGMACAVLALVFLVFGLAVGLRGAPPLSPRPPTIDAALVIAHALVGLGLLAFAVALLRIGERFFVGRPGADGARGESSPPR